MSLQNSLAKGFNNFKAGVFARYADNTDKFLTDTAAIGWLLASAANTTGVFFNKKIDKKRRKYLAAQEMTDGIINVALFYCLTNSLIKGARKLVDKGIIGSDLLKKGSDEFKKFKGGVGTIASLIGAVVTNNIITPIIRNKIATAVQKRHVKNGTEGEIHIPSSYIPYTFSKKPLSVQSYANYAKVGGNMKV